MFCIKCGAQNQLEASFCFKCGTPLPATPARTASGVSQPDSAPPAPPARVAAPSQQAGALAPLITSASIPTVAAAQRPVHRRLLLWVALGLGVAVLGVASVLTYFHFKSTGEPRSAPVNGTSEPQRDVGQSPPTVASETPPTPSLPTPPPQSGGDTDLCEQYVTEVDACLAKKAANASPPEYIPRVKEVQAAVCAAWRTSPNYDATVLAQALESCTHADCAAAWYRYSDCVEDYLRQSGMDMAVTDGPTDICRRYVVQVKACLAQSPELYPNQRVTEADFAAKVCIIWKTGPRFTIDAMARALQSCEPADCTENPGQYGGCVEEAMRKAGLDTQISGLVMAVYIGDAEAVVAAVSPSNGGAMTARDLQVQAWLAGPLRGSDNWAAASKEVTIQPSGDGYEVSIRSQFGFRCGVEFDESGDPTTLQDCRSSEPGWGASPAAIQLRCRTQGAARTCRGSYRLLDSSGSGNNDAMEIILEGVPPTQTSPGEGSGGTNRDVVPEIATSDVKRALVGQQLGSGWIFEASEPLNVAIVTRSNDGRMATLVVDMSTSSVDGCQAAQGTVKVYLYWNGVRWRFTSMENVSFSVTRDCRNDPNR
jgi:hypothetical protein